MQYRHYHMRLDLTPSWGSVMGFGMDRRIMEWIQSPKWWQMILVDFGGVLTVNGAPVPFPERSLLVVPPGARCVLERITTDSITLHWLKFKPDDNGEVMSAVPQVHPFTRDFDHFQDQFRAALDFMPYSRAKLNALTWHLLWVVSKNAAVVPEEPSLTLIENLIKNRIAEPISIPDLAEEANISVATMTSMFRDQHNQTPSDYIKTLRMQLACALLMKSQKQIKEIATLVGYPNLQRFNKVIRETFGCSPRTLRQDHPTQTVYVHLADEDYQRGIAEQAEPVRPELAQG